MRQEPDFSPADCPIFQAMQKKQFDEEEKKVNMDQLLDMLDEAEEDQKKPGIDFFGVNMGHLDKTFSCKQLKNKYSEIIPDLEYDKMELTPEAKDFFEDIKLKKKGRAENSTEESNAREPQTTTQREEEGRDLGSNEINGPAGYASPSAQCCIIT